MHVSYVIVLLTLSLGLTGVSCSSGKVCENSFAQKALELTGSGFDIVGQGKVCSCDFVLVWFSVLFNPSVTYTHARL